MKRNLSIVESTGLNSKFVSIESKSGGLNDETFCIVFFFSFAYTTSPAAVMSILYCDFQEHVVVLMAADDMDINMQVILKDPKWSQRVVYMRGSVLKDTDLKRCRIADAEAVFILAPRYIKDRSNAVS